MQGAAAGAHRARVRRDDIVALVRPRIISGELHHAMGHVFVHSRDPSVRRLSGGRGKS